LEEKRRLCRARLQSRIAGRGLRSALRSLRGLRLQLFVWTKRRRAAGGDCTAGAASRGGRGRSALRTTLIGRRHGCGGLCHHRKVYRGVVERCAVEKAGLYASTSRRRALSQSEMISDFSVLCPTAPHPIIRQTTNTRPTATEQAAEILKYFEHSTAN
jgi:hypothetical protein